MLDEDNEQTPFPWWASTLIVVVIANAIVGVIVFEWAWCGTQRFRKPNKELN